jgi:hypothetical protein
MLVFLPRNAAFLVDGLSTGCRDSTLARGNNLREGEGMRKSVMSLIASALLSSVVLVHAEDAPDPASAGESPEVATGAQPDGTVNFTGGSIAAGIGFSWGHGELNYGGQSHAFKISGVSLVDVGAANVSASGHVYNLKNLADFNGNYVAIAAGMTVAGGGSAAYLKNEHGVIIKLHSTDVGLRFNLSADGVKVTLAS